MKLTLIRGEERAELKGDDDFLEDSIGYRVTFERRARELVKAFYRQEPQEPPHDPGP